MRQHIRLHILYVFIYSCIFAIAAAVLFNPEYSFSIRATEPCDTPVPSPSPSSSPKPSPSISPQPTAYVFLSEFMACPSSGNEWIELFNGAETATEIANWQIIDAVGNKKLISGTVPAMGYAVFEWSGSLLNNTGDSFTVFTPDNLPIGSASYSNCTTGVSFVYENGIWVPAIASPAEQTTVSQNTLTSSSAAASLKTNTSMTSNLLANGLSDTTYSTPFTLSSPVASFPFTIPVVPTSLLETPTETSEANPPTPGETKAFPVASVIIGGLLQLLPSTYILYDSYFKSSA